MKYKRFEDLPVWNDAIDFSVEVFEFTSQSRGLFADLVYLKNQIERASVSISNNIAEGFERGSNAELIHFLYIAQGSCGECRSITHIFGNVPNFRSKKHQVISLRSAAEGISKQLYGWIDSLKNSSINGEKFLDDAERARLRRIKEPREFQEVPDRASRGEKVDLSQLSWNRGD
ncbi:MAG TPA: four helix bundle protein [Aridibacter sp.]|nr:four helix bundle protein [Aridibacter sp.]